MGRQYTPLPPRATSALEHLKPLIHSTSGSVTYETAKETLIDAGFERGEVDDLIKVLLRYGYLYSVHGDLRVAESS